MNHLLKNGKIIGNIQEEFLTDRVISEFLALGYQLQNNAEIPRNTPEIKINLRDNIFRIEEKLT